MRRGLSGRRGRGNDRVRSQLYQMLGSRAKYRALPALNIISLTHNVGIKAFNECSKHNILTDPPLQCLQKDAEVNLNRVLFGGTSSKLQGIQLR